MITTHQIRAKGGSKIVAENNITRDRDNEKQMHTEYVLLS